VCDTRRRLRERPAGDSRAARLPTFPIWPRNLADPAPTPTATTGSLRGMFSTPEPSTLKAWYRSSARDRSKLVNQTLKCERIETCARIAVCSILHTVKRPVGSGMKASLATWVVFRTWASDGRRTVHDVRGARHLLRGGRLLARKLSARQKLVLFLVQNELSILTHVCGPSRAERRVLPNVTSERLRIVASGGRTVGSLA